MLTQFGSNSTTCLKLGPKFDQTWPTCDPNLGFAGAEATRSRILPLCVNFQGPLPSIVLHLAVHPGARGAASVVLARARCPGSVVRRTGPPALLGVFRRGNAPRSASPGGLQQRRATPVPLRTWPPPAAEMRLCSSGTGAASRWRRGGPLRHPPCGIGAVGERGDDPTCGGRAQIIASRPPDPGQFSVFVPAPLPEASANGELLKNRSENGRLTGAQIAAPRGRKASATSSPYCGCTAPTSPRSSTHSGGSSSGSPQSASAVSSTP